MNIDPKIKDQMARIRMRSEWVDPGDAIPVSASHSAKEIFDALVAELTENHCRILRSMPYEQFVYTDYWRIVRDMVLWKNKVCAECGGGRIFQVHHKTYKHHGYEHLHLEDLIVLCRDCHALLHSKIKAAQQLQQLLTP